MGDGTAVEIPNLDTILVHFAVADGLKACPSLSNVPKWITYAGLRIYVRELLCLSARKLRSDLVYGCLRSFLGDTAHIMVLDHEEE